MKDLSKKRIVRYSDEKAYQKLVEMGIVSYAPTLHQILKFVFVETDMSDAELLDLPGIVEVTPSRTGTVNI